MMPAPIPGMPGCCGACGSAVPPGAFTCPACGTPSLGLTPGAASPAPPPGVVAPPSVRALHVVEGGPVTSAVPAPPEGVEVLLGRHDLTRVPPWVVDVDLGRLMGLQVGEGPPVSRDQASLARRAGQLIVTPHGQAPTLCRPQGASQFALVPVGTAQPLNPGDRVAFGHGSRVLVLEAR